MAANPRASGSRCDLPDIEISLKGAGNAPNRITTGGVRPSHSRKE